MPGAPAGRWITRLQIRRIGRDRLRMRPAMFALSVAAIRCNVRKLPRAGVRGILDPDSTFENMIDLRDAIDAGIVEGPRMSCDTCALFNNRGGTAAR